MTSIQDATSSTPPQLVSESLIQAATPPSSKKRPAFARRHINGRDAYPSKRLKASFDKQPERQSILYTSPLMLHYEIHCSFNGLADLSRHLYEILTSRDMKLRNLISESELRYTILMATIYRCATIANHTKSDVISQLSYLKECVLDLPFPEVICHYIESFGIVECLGLKCIPFFRDYLDMITRADFTDPVFLLREMNLDAIPHDTPFRIHKWTILKYAKACSRLSRTMLSVRAVDYKNMTGRPEILAAYIDDEIGLVTPFTMERLPVNQAQIGAALRYRDLDLQSDWDGQVFPHLHSSVAFDRDMVLTSYINASLR